VRTEAKVQRWRPIACVTISDRGLATRIVDALQRQGYCVLEHRTGLDLIGALADLIEGAQERVRVPWRPQLIVVDVRTRGCSGTTIARGLHDLGISVPIILIGKPGACVPADHVFAVTPEEAVARVPELARRWAPVRVLDLDPPRQPERVLA
jgi:hypothetical protein